MFPPLAVASIVDIWIQRVFTNIINRIIIKIDHQTNMFYLEQHYVL